MAWQKVNRAIGGVTPLGVFTITPNTPQNILANTELESKRYAFQCRQLGFSVSGTPSGEVYLNYGDTPGLGDQTVLIIPSASAWASLPLGSFTTESMIDATQYFLDGSEACVVTVYAMDATS